MNSQTQKASRTEGKWLKAVNELLASITQWSGQAGWSVESEQTLLTEEKLGTYTVDVLHIKANGGRLHVEPVGRSVPHAEGRVDLYAYPSLHRVRLLLKGGQWVIHTESGIDWPKPWGRQTFVALAKELVAAP